MAKKQDVNLNEIDANFVISQFKNKDRRNNPSSIPRALVPEQETEKEQEPPEEKETPREETKRKRAKSPDYESLFLADAGIPTRSGKLVSIREKYHKRIAKIVQSLGQKDVSIFSYIDNVLSHHFDTYQDEINEIYNKDNDDDYLIQKK
jgi:Protein of unknown function (DUF3408).